MQDHLNALEQIGDMGSPHDVGHICRFIFSTHDIIAQKTASVIRKLLTKKEVNLAWHNLYNSCSFCFGDYHLNNADLFGKTDFKKIANFTPEEAAHLYGIASLNRNGHVREDALDYLKNLSTPEILPYILLRLNDWVPQVRTKAKEVLIKIRPSMVIADLIKYYSLIEWLDKTGRVKLSDVQSKIFEPLQDPNNREPLFKAMQNASFMERIFCWRALAREIANDDTLIDKAIVDPAPEVREWAVRHLPKTIHFKNRLSTLLSDNAIRVRYAALKAIPREDFEGYREFYEAAIFNDSKPIREYAQFMLRSYGDNNSANKYRRKLSELKNKVNAGVVAGLAETGKQEDATLIQPYVNHETPKIRAAALSALNRLGAEGVDKLYLLGIQDNNAKVRNLCVSILQSGYRHLRTGLEDTLAKGNIKSQKAALKVLMNYGGLDSLCYILQVLAQTSEELQITAWHYLVYWHRHYAARPWFSFSDDTYTQTLHWLAKLRETNIAPPYQALTAWNDLPNIMKTIKK